MVNVLDFEKTLDLILESDPCGSAEDMVIRLDGTILGDMFYIPCIGNKLYPLSLGMRDILKMAILCNVYTLRLK